MRFTLQVRLNPIGTDLSSGAVLTWIRVRDHPGIILDMFLNPIAAGLDTTLTRASLHLESFNLGSRVPNSKHHALKHAVSKVKEFYLSICR